MDNFLLQLTQANPPEFMSSTLKELGIGTYQNVAMVGDHVNKIKGVTLDYKSVYLCESTKNMAIAEAVEMNWSESKYTV